MQNRLLHKLLIALSALAWSTAPFAQQILPPDTAIEAAQQVQALQPPRFEPAVTEAVTGMGSPGTELEFAL